MTLDWLKNIDPDTLAKFAALEVKRDDDWFLKESIEIIMVMPDSTQVYKFWRANLDCLNEDLLTILEQWAKKNLTSSRSKKACALAKELIFFSDYIDEFPLGSIAINKELAIKGYQLVLTVLTFKKFPQDWARIQNVLGLAYWSRIRGERADNLETAIACYQEALKIYTFTAFPQDWAMTQGNLAVALGSRASLTNNAQDLDQAIELYGQALTVSAPGSYYFISQQYRLGNTLARRYETSKNPDDLQQSLAAYQIALDYLSPEHYDHQQFWQAIPATQAILGSRLVRDGNWQEGLKLLVNSLNQLKTGDNSLVYANALYQTGYAYELLSDQENARLYYRDALRLYEHLQDLPGIATSRESLGNVFVSQGHLEKGMSELAQARDIYQQLGKTEAAEKVDNTYQSVQQVLEQVKSEVLA